METWGPHSFDNDVAKDWAAAYRDMGLTVAKSTIDVALGDAQNNALSADLSCRAIAAAEAVAFAAGRGSPEALAIFAGAPTADQTDADAICEDAATLLKAILAASELKIQWIDANQEGVWAASVTELKARLVDEGAVVPDATPDPLLRPARPAATADASLDAISASIAALSDDVQRLRQEMAENMLRLAELIEARD